MRRSLENTVLVLVIVVMLLGSLGGCCYYCCPAYPQEEWTPEITGQKFYCGDYCDDCADDEFFISDIRDIAPKAYHRWSAEEESWFTTVADTQKVINKISGTGGDMIAKFKAELGCSKLPFGGIKHFNGDEEHITAVMETPTSEVEFYVLGPGNILVKIYPDNSIAEIDFY